MITAKTKQLAIIGDPIEHSFSPKMHNFISGYMGKDYVYTAYRVKPEALGNAIRGIRALGIKGVNVTAPHKIEVMQYLDYIMPVAERLGSVNTILNRGGKLYGYNTDSDGFYLALINAGIKITGSKILVMGAGGVVAPTLLRLIDEKPRSVTLVNRTKQKAEALAEAIFAKTGYKIETEIDEPKFDIVLNTTSAGMEPQLNALPIDSIDEIDNLDFIGENTAAVDMIYNPDETLFLKLARLRGAKTLNGLDMLIYQGIIAYELFSGTKLPDNMAALIKKEVFGK